MNQKSLETTRRSVAAKINPSVLLASTFVYSLFGYLVGEAWTDPHLLELVCDRDGNLYAREGNIPFFGRLLCTRSALIELVLDIAEQVNLSPRERTYLLERIPTPKSKC